MTSSAFPPTRLSVLERLRGGEPEIRRTAFGVLVEGYWKPVYKYLRIRWRLQVSDAEDATQAFFATAFEKAYFERYDPARARFRTFLRVCLDRYMMNERQAATRLRRGGDARLVHLDFAAAEGEVERMARPIPVDTEALFRHELLRELFARSVGQLKDELTAAGKQVHFALFERYDLGPEERLAYADLAAEFGIPITTVTNWLALARRRFRERVLANLRELAGTEEDFRLEARELLGIDPS